MDENKKHYFIINSDDKVESISPYEPNAAPHRVVLYEGSIPQKRILYHKDNFYDKDIYKIVNDVAIEIDDYELAANLEKKLNEYKSLKKNERLSNINRKLDKKISLTEIYKAKYTEALALISGDLNENDLIYILEEANLKEITSLELANIIVMKYGYALNNTENLEKLRIKYNTLIKNSVDISEVDDLMVAFLDELSSL